jgi:hypothetical protein
MRLRVTYASIALLVAAIFTPYTASAAEVTSATSIATARYAAAQYLLESGIDPGSATFQVGAHNYVGDECPGSGWNCTTASVVVQISTSNLIGAVNIAQCGGTQNGTPTPGFGSAGSCTIFQSTTTGLNQASCVETSSDPAAAEVCNITQLNSTGTNQAYANQLITQYQPSGLQDGTQEANVLQGNVAGANESLVIQTLGQTQSTMHNGVVTTQTQEAHQLARVCQGGPSPCANIGTNPFDPQNISGVWQSNVQLASVQFNFGSAGMISQFQNKDPNRDARTIALVRQNSKTKTNAAGLLHFTRQLATVHTAWSGEDDDRPSAITGFLGTVVQQQGNGISCVGVAGKKGGLCGFEFQDSAGAQTAAENQDELQREIAPQGPNTSQTQYGDEFCCATQTGGNAANKNFVSQSKVQIATGTLVRDDPVLQHGQIWVHCVSLPNGCFTSQILTQDGTTQTGNCAGSSCNQIITCNTTPSEVGGSTTFCQPPVPAEVTPIPPPNPSFVGN